MNNRFYLSLSFITILLFVGCSDYAAERKQVADLMDQLDAAKKVFAGTHPDSLEIKDSDIGDRLLIISEHYKRNNDTIGMELGLLLGDFKGYRKAFKGLATKRKLISEEIERTYTQLGSLDTDLRNGSLDKNQVIKYMDEERLATKTVTMNIYQLDTLLKRGAAGFHKYAPRIDSVMTNLGADN